MIFAIPTLFPSQKEPLETVCLGSCGKLALGSIDVGDCGPCAVCTHDDCPIEKGRTDTVGESGMTGEVVCIRGLLFGDDLAERLGAK